MRKAILTAFLAFATICNCQAAKYKAPASVSVIPQPQEVLADKGHFNARGASVSVDPALGEFAQKRVAAFATRLSMASGKESAIVKKGRIAFRKDATLQAEAYVITISPKKVDVAAADLNGCVYAIQTLKQMLPEAIFAGEAAADADWTLPCVLIRDWPRFQYRGMHLDVVRHFFSKEEVLRYIDLLEMHKMNRLHWHLTDDQGWRIPVDAYPRLAEVSSHRAQTVIGRNSGKYDGIPHGGCYTKAEIREIVAYAQERGITIIPEVDMPGHMVAALAAYPELGCTGGPYEVWQKWGISKDVLCLGKDATYDFLKAVFDEVCELFPSEYIHIGGDECPKARWKECPDCQAKIAELGLKGDGKYSAEYYLQSYVTKYIENYLASKGRKVIGWDEILEGEISPNATVMSWRGVKGGRAAVKLGHTVIMTPNSHFYFDYYQTKSPKEREPLGIGNFIPVEKVYGFEPFTEDMTEEQRSLILGCQANMWTEYVATNEHLEHMVLPRMCALSEVQWCRPERKDYDRFLGNMSKMFRILDRTAYSYAPYLKEDGTVK